MSDSIHPQAMLRPCDDVTATIDFDGAGIVLQPGWTIRRPTRQERIIELREELVQLESSGVLIEPDWYEVA